MIISSAVAIEASIINNYLVADYFLKRNRVTGWLSGLLRYHGSAGVSIATQYAVANALYYLAHNINNPLKPGTHYPSPVLLIKKLLPNNGCG